MTRRSNTARNADLIAGFIKAYWMEIETIQNYIANSVNRTQARHAGGVVGIDGPAMDITALRTVHSGTEGDVLFLARR